MAEGESTVYANLHFIRGMASVAIEHFDELAVGETHRLSESLQELSLSSTLAAITGCCLEAQKLLEQGKLS